MKNYYALTLFLLTLPFSLWGTERNVSLLKQWKFYPAYDVSRSPAKTDVCVPHSWNLSDVFDGMKYDRSTYVYEYTLTMTADQLREKRHFLRFNAVNSFAEVAVNKKYVGHHAGGYTAFCFEITEGLKEGDNLITVVASNAYRTDVAPLAGDFNIYGGITRPVELITTGLDCISPLDHASSGVYIYQDHVDAKSADIRISTILSLTSDTKDHEVRVQISDADGHIVATRTSTDPTITLSLAQPRLWDGRQQPHLYSVQVELLKSGHVVDRIVEHTGLRSFSIDAERGFSLNGHPLDLYGVCRHEEAYGKGGLYDEETMRLDADIIYEMGATGVRFVHYPHSRYDVRQYDERGIVLWYELNLAGPGGYNSPGYMKNPQLEANVMQNLEEMIKQNFNSPAICFWALCNELSFKYDEPATFLRALNARAKQLDPQRLTTLAICYDQEQFQGITDTFGWNKYFGYYENKSGVGDFLDQAKILANGIPMGLCEYGAAGSHLQHGFERKITNKIHYEENQARVHEENWRDVVSRPYIWCKFIWQYNDNPSSIRDEGDRKGMNDKGIVSYDRSVRKDAYYFYKANWTTEPMLYLAARRYTQRTEAQTDVKVYTNLPHATLYINGKRIGKAHRDSIGCILFRNITLREGENTITVRSGKWVDEYQCTLDSSKAPKKDTSTSDERLDGAVN